MKKIVIIQTRPGIGDMCIFLNAIKKIKEENLNASVTLITKKSSRAKNFIKNDFINLQEIVYIDEIKKRSTFLTLIKFLINRKYNQAFIFHYGFKYFLACKLSNIKKVYHYGFLKKKENISNKITKLITIWLNLKNYDSTANIYYNGDVINGKKILIGVGSSGETRKWKVENFLNLIRMINSLDNYKYYILAGEKEKNIANKIISKCENIHIENLCDKNIYETFKFIKKSLIYVGTDSAFMHLSAALGVKSYGLFGDTPTNYSDYSRNIFPIIPEGYQKISHRSNAMNKIEAKWVFEIIKKSLN